MYQGCIVFPGARKIRNNHGYILIRAPLHPNSYKNGYVLEHRYIMSCALKRPISHHEHIHHLNGIRDDNNLSNLLPLSASEHAHHTARMRHFEQINYILPGPGQLSLFSGRNHGIQPT